VLIEQMHSAFTRLPLHFVLIIIFMAITPKVPTGLPTLVPPPPPTPRQSPRVKRAFK
jgi:hypothetical protein